MARYLITFTNGFGELIATFVDSDELRTGPVPLPDALVACFDKEQIRSSYRYWDWPPEFAYRVTARTDPEADYLVYRETPNGNLSFKGAVACELIRPGIADVQAQSAA